MENKLDAALVLEGGALRSLYTAGVLDVFIEKGIEFSYVIGTSAGSLCGLNYISKQAKRTMYINLHYRNDKNYIALRNRFRHGAVINLDFLFEEPNGRWAEFDEETYFNSESRFVIAATSCETGKPVYFEKPNGDELIAALKASSSMPLISKKITTSQGLCLDGGIADSIPYKKAMEDGNKKIVVVRTRSHDYRKKTTSGSMKRMYRAAYRKYKEFTEGAVKRPQVYNQQVDELYKLERSGGAFIIEPGADITVSRIEKDKEKLRALYIQGRQDAIRLAPQVIKYTQMS